MPYHRRLFKTGHSLALTLPPAALDSLRLREGDFVLIDVSFEGVIVLTRSNGPAIIAAVSTVQGNLTPPPSGVTPP